MYRSVTESETGRGARGRLVPWIEGIGIGAVVVVVVAVAFL